LSWGGAIKGKVKTLFLSVVTMKNYKQFGKISCKTMRQIHWEMRLRRWKRIAAKAKQFFNSFHRIDAGSSVFAVIALTIITAKQFV